MSTLRVTTVTNPSGGQPTIDGLAKAWVNFNGTGTVAIRASFNVSSITDNGAGNYTVNFTNAMADANYATQYMNDNGARYLWIDTVTTSSVKVYCFGPSAYFDTSINCVSIFR